MVVKWHFIIHQYFHQGATLKNTSAVFYQNIFWPWADTKCLFSTTKIFSETHYHTYFYGNRHFYPSYHTPKKRDHKKHPCSIFFGFSITGGRMKNHFKQKKIFLFFIKNCCKIYSLIFIQKISRKINFSFFLRKWVTLLPSFTIFSIPLSKNKKCYHFFLP